MCSTPDGALCGPVQMYTALWTAVLRIAADTVLFFFSHPQYITQSFLVALFLSYATQIPASPHHSAPQLLPPTSSRVILFSLSAFYFPCAPDAQTGSPAGKRRGAKEESAKKNVRLKSETRRSEIKETRVEKKAGD